MKITISSPDGLGDFVLRIPMIRALQDAGHQLQIFLRQPAAALASEVLSGVALHEIAADPNLESTRRRRNPFRAEHAAILKFQPDLYVAPLFALNFFDEVWMECNRSSVPVAGFSTPDEFHTSGTVGDPAKLSSCFQIKVEVPVGLPELEKNRFLGSSILGFDLPLLPPKITPGIAALDEAHSLLARHGLKEGGYWVACVGGRSGLKMKDWGEINWKKFFSSIMPTDGRSLLFLGNTKEWESIERIRSQGFSSINLADTPPSIPISLALLSMSCGYVGRDSGVMHLATALERPLLAAYGGGHWGRFLPSSGPAIAVTQAMSCRMCDFSCPHEQPHCITGIRMETMISAWERLPMAKGVEIMEQGINPLIDCISSEEAFTFAMAEDKARRERSAILRSEGVISRFLRERFGIH